MLDLVRTNRQCSKDDALEWLCAEGLLPAPEEASRKGNAIAAVYEYHGPDNALIYQVLRKAPKTFRQRRPDGNGGWVWNMDGVERLPYRVAGTAERRAETHGLRR